MSQSSPKTASLITLLIRRALMSAVVILITVLITFVAIHSLPGDPVLSILGGPMAAPSPEEVSLITRELNLDKPLWQQFLLQISHMLRGDFGTSFSQHIPVSKIIGEEIGATVALTFSALAVAWIYAVTSVLAFSSRSRILTGLSSTLEVGLSSLPQAWISLMLLFAFSFTLPLFPPAGNDGLASLVLPALALGLPMGGYIAQVVREGFVIAMDQPFLLAARLRGRSDLAVRTLHALRHAVGPAIALSAWAIGSLMANAVLVELIFSRRGLGRTLYNAVSEQDMPLAIGITLIVTLTYILAGLLADGLGVLIDPRVIEEDQ